MNDNTPVMTTGERVGDACMWVSTLIARYHLPAPQELRIRTAPDLFAEWSKPGEVVAEIRLKDEAKLRRWAEATNAEVTASPHYDGYLHVACTVLGDVPLRLTAFGKALTP
jgi:hypothetical protein